MVATHTGRGEVFGTVCGRAVRGEVLVDLWLVGRGAEESGCGLGLAEDKTTGRVGAVMGGDLLGGERAGSRSFLDC